MLLLKLALIAFISLVFLGASTDFVFIRATDGTRTNGTRPATQIIPRRLEKNQKRTNTQSTSLIKKQIRKEYTSQEIRRTPSNGKIATKARLLKENLSLQLEALKKIQQKFTSTIQENKGKDDITTFKASCSASNIQPLIDDIYRIIPFLDDTSKRSIAVGATPDISKDINTLVKDLKKNEIECSSLQSLAKQLNTITQDIYNPTVSCEY